MDIDMFGEDRLFKLLQLNTNENFHMENVVILAMLSGNHGLMCEILSVWATHRFRGLDIEPDDNNAWMFQRETVYERSIEIIKDKFGQDFVDKIQKCL